MNLSNGASRIGSPAERLPGWWRPVPLSIGTAGLALALVLGAGPVAASAAAAGGVARTTAKVAPPPDTSGLHPVDYSLEMLGRFSGGVAAVKSQGKWGYVDKAGKTVVPFLYDQATPFDGGYAAVIFNGRWTIIDQGGKQATPPQPLSRMSRFSEGLAAAKTTAGGGWGYVDRTGAFVIPPQFTNADPFSQGLAPVSYGGSWFYITKAGAFALGTSFYRAYPFSADGLALVQPSQDGQFGYIRRDGTFAIAPTFVEAREFSQGLAPVRVGSRWGYVTTSGALAIPGQFVEAFPFNGGLALVQVAASHFSFVGPTGKPAYDADFALAGSYSDGVAIVGDGKRFWYVDTKGARLPLGAALAPLPGDSTSTGDCSDPSSWQTVTTSFTGGLVFFQVVNQTKMQWSVEGVDSWKDEKVGSGSGMMVVPGLPALVDSVTAPENGIYTFLYYYQSLAENLYPTGDYPLFSMTLTSATGGYTVVLSNINLFTTPAPPKTTPWWDFLKAGIDIVEGLLGAVTGDLEATAGSIMKITTGIHDIVSGALDGSGNNNASSTTQNVLQTKLTAALNGNPFQPLTGGYCGGDSYTISDDANYVIVLNTVKSALMPPTIQLTIYPYSAYFAQNALAKLDTFRKGNEPGGGAYTASPYSCIYNLAFENWSDTGNNNPCSQPPFFPGYDYATTAASFSQKDALAWWDFANNLPDAAANQPTDVVKWMRQFAGRCGAVAPLCPNAQVMSASSTNLSQTTDESTCSFTITLTSPGGVISAPTLPSDWGLGNTCMQIDPDKLPATCSLDLYSPAGSSGTVRITDSYTTIPIKVSCAARHMVLQQLTYSGTSWPGPCLFSVQVSGPRGAVTATPSTFVTANGCTQQTDGNCTLSLSVPSGTPSTAISLSDGPTTLPINVQCNDVPMTLPKASGFQQSTAFSTCSFPVTIDRPHAAVSVTPASWLGPSSCTGPMATCQLTMVVPMKNSVYQYAGISDGFTQFNNIDFACYGCQGMTIPQGVYSAPMPGCQVNVPVYCARPPVTAVSIPAGAVVDTSGCSSGGDCQVVVTAPYDGNVTLQDGVESQASFAVKCR